MTIFVWRKPALFLLQTNQNQITHWCSIYILLCIFSSIGIENKKEHTPFVRTGLSDLPVCKQMEHTPYLSLEATSLGFCQTESTNLPAVTKSDISIVLIEVITCSSGANALYSHLLQLLLHALITLIWVDKLQRTRITNRINSNKIFPRKLWPFKW